MISYCLLCAIGRVSVFLHFDVGARYLCVIVLLVFAGASELSWFLFKFERCSRFLILIPAVFVL